MNGRLTIIFLNTPFAAESYDTYKDLSGENATNFYACNLSVYLHTYIHSFSVSKLAGRFVMYMSAPEHENKINLPFHAKLPLYRTTLLSKLSLILEPATLHQVSVRCLIYTVTVSVNEF